MSSLSSQDASVVLSKNLSQLMRFAARAPEPLVQAREEPAFVLATWPWRETSLIAELFTPRFGRVAVTVRGAKRKGNRFRGIVSPFIPLLVSFSGRGEIKNLTEARYLGSLAPLRLEESLTALYVNELLMRLTARENPQKELFDAYRAIITLIASGETEAIERALRCFEVDLLRLCGWGQSLTGIEEAEYCVVRSGEILDAAHVALQPEEDVFTADVARAVLAKDFSNGAQLKSARLLLKAIVGYYIGERGMGIRRTLEAWREF